MPDDAAFQDVYLRVYREAPYHEGPADAARFGADLAAERESPGFAIRTVEEDGRLGGFAYGLSRAAGWWHPKATAPAPEQLAGRPMFYVVELAVLPELRGRGHGRTLLDELLAGRAEPYALLASRKVAPARALYHRWGWRQVGEFVGGEIDLLALPL